MSGTSPYYAEAFSPLPGRCFRLVARHSEYDNPAMNRLIDRALAEPDPARPAALWAEADRRIMGDAPIVPLIWETYSFLWAPRVHGWVHDPWTTMPDLTTPWLDPPTH